MKRGIPRLIHEIIGNHQRQKAQQKGQENGQHHNGQSQVILVPEKL
jgi:hypothetical protein